MIDTASLSAKYGSVVSFVGRDGTEFVFRPPTPDEFATVTNKVAQGDARGPLFRDLLQRTLVSPAVERGSDVAPESNPALAAINAEFEARPAIPTVVQRRLWQAAGSQTDVVVNEDHVLATFPDGTSLCFRCPSLDEFEDLQHKLATSLDRVSVFRETAVVSHDGDATALAATLRKYPASVERLADGIATLAGGELEVVVKKG